MVHELPLFIELGAATIRGLNVDMSPYPPDTYLCYHHDPALYGQDLELILERPPASPIRTEQVLHAAIMSSDLDYLETAGEPIIYHADLVNGNLAEFYHELYLTTLSNE